MRVQAAGSWSMDACCAVHGNDCHRGGGNDYCFDHTSSSDWLFGLWPGPAQRFEPTGTATDYQWIRSDWWVRWGGNGLVGLAIGATSAAPGGAHAYCGQGSTYHGMQGEVCGGTDNWGATDVEVWYPSR